MLNTKDEVKTGGYIHMNIVLESESLAMLQAKPCTCIAVLLQQGASVHKRS